MGKNSKRDIPVFATPIIETHCHLDYLDADELDATLARSRSVGVQRIITIAVSPGNLATVRNLTEYADDIWGTQGIHPHEAEAYNEAVEQEIREGLRAERILAVGEIGLDYYYDNADRGVQRAVFERQLQLAVDTQLPVVIHTRSADEDTRSILQQFSGQLPRGGVIHSFTSGMALAEYCLAEGFMLGFNGITTFNRAENVREVVRATPTEQLLLETDAPYLTPVPYRGKPNAPFYLPFIAEQVAALKQLDVEALLAQAFDNSDRLFFAEKVSSTA
ncbi:MAG: TatD family hydrolase [Halioglobus sp.]